MKLLTKEWYQTMQDSGLGLLLEVDERAAECSEELFQTIWEEKLSAHLEDRRGLCPYLREAFDEERERANFAESYRWMLKDFRERTPAEILARVADIRLLALGYCTEEVSQALEEYRRTCHKRTDEAMDEAWNQREAAGLDQVWTGEHSLHDSVVLALNREGEDLRIEFERDDVDWPEIKAVRFRDARVRTMDKSPEQGWWLYDEIYRTENGYEIHALLDKGGLCELTVECGDVEVIWTVPPKTE